MFNVDVVVYLLADLLENRRGAGNVLGALGRKFKGIIEERVRMFRVVAERIVHQLCVALELFRLLKHSQSLEISPALRRQRPLGRVLGKQRMLKE